VRSHNHAKGDWEGGSRCGRIVERSFKSLFQTAKSYMAYHLDLLNNMRAIHSYM